MLEGVGVGGGGVEAETALKLAWLTSWWATCRCTTRSTKHVAEAKADVRAKAVLQTSRSRPYAKSRKKRGDREGKKKKNKNTQYKANDYALLRAWRQRLATAQKPACVAHISLRSPTFLPVHLPWWNTDTQ